MKRVDTPSQCGYCYLTDEGWDKCPYHERKSASCKRFKVYALKLEHGKYYVGITSRKDVNTRVEEHISGVGARWTLLHKPVDIIEVKDLGLVPKKVAENTENEITIEYMDRFGTQNVRGGKNVSTGHILFRQYNYLSQGWLIVVWTKIILWCVVALFAYAIITRAQA